MIPGGNNRGQSLVEYLVLLAGVSLVLMAALKGMGAGWERWWGRLCLEFFFPGP